MKRDKQKSYKVVAFYDTETTNIYKKDKIEDDEKGIVQREQLHAFPCLYIYNTINCSIADYQEDVNDNVEFYRNYKDILKAIDNTIKEADNYIPVVAAYNLMFDLQPIFYELNQKYFVVPIAQSGTSAYAIDLYYYNDLENKILRFWDVSYLEPRGLWAMGEAVGVKKAVGDWDYSLVRHGKTELTDEELFYAKRDVQVIPAYLKYLLDANKFLEENDLGNHLLTKTGLVRLLAKRVTGTIPIKGRKRDYTLEQLFRFKCDEEQPKSYSSYALRKSSFRGGLTFTAAKYASNIFENVVSVDAVSMHHAHINGMLMFYKFSKTSNATLKRQLHIVGKTQLDDILRFYECPFKWGIHAKVKVFNPCLKPGTIFDTSGIATLAEAKFGSGGEVPGEFEKPRNEEAIKDVKKAGYQDSAKKGKFAYSKLMEAKEIIIHVSEIEWWIFCQVYAFDDFEVLEGESSTTRGLAPEYVTLLSNMLYKQKNEMKQVIKTYQENSLNDVSHAQTLPAHIREMIREGSASEAYLESYYKNIIKGQYNAIYGAQAQDVYRPNFKIEDNNIVIDDDTRINKDNFETKKGDLVLYTYGLRIVGRSRLHLIIAMLLLDEAFGNKIKILGGDTDSLKISTSKEITDEMIINALKPLHKATKNSIDIVQKDIRNNHKQYASDLKDLGNFEIETYDGGKYSRYKKHIELWNKCRVSIDYNNKVHITAAGVARPSGKYNLENLANDMITKYDEDEILQLICSYNTFYDASISYMLNHRKPDYTSIFEYNVKDYNELNYRVHEYESIALQETSKKIGETTKLCNIENIRYKKQINQEIDENEKEIFITDTKAYIVYAPDTKFERVYEIERR